MLGGLLLCSFVLFCFFLFSPLFFYFLFQQGALKVLPVFLGFFICAASVVAIACDIARDYIFNQGARPLPDTEEVGTTQFGAEEWLGIGSFLFYFFLFTHFFLVWFGLEGFFFNLLLYSFEFFFLIFLGAFLGLVDVAPAAKTGTNGCVRCLDWICGGRTKISERTV